MGSTNSSINISPVLSEVQRTINIELLVVNVDISMIIMDSNLVTDGVNIYE